jgi:putative ABC transport system permease protein
MSAALITSIKYNVRIFRRDGPFLIASVLALGLGIGASTVTFGIVDLLWLKPLPFNDPENIVQIVRAGRNGLADLVSTPLVLGWQKAPAIEALGAYTLFPTGLNLETGDQPVRVAGMPVSADFFTVFGVKAAFGRTLVPYDTRPGAPLSVLLSDRFWKSNFNGNPRMLGTSVRMNKEVYTVVGVMPPSFRFPTSADVWIPLQLPVTSTDPTNLYLAVAKLKPGVSIGQAAQQLNAIMTIIANGYPAGTFTGVKAVVLPLQKYLAGSVSLLIMIVTCAVSLVVLIACVNFGILLLGSLSGHSKDIAVRIALGANRLSLARELLVGSILLALTGYAVGLLFAWVSGNLAMRFLTTMPQVSRSVFNVPVLLFSLLLAILIGLIVGLAPIARLTSIPVEQSLRDNADWASGGRTRQRLRRVIIVCEVAFSMVLLVGTGVFVKGLLQAINAKPGFEPENVLTFEMSYPQQLCADRKKFNLFTNSVLTGLSTIPAVQQAASTSTLPLERGPDFPFTFNAGSGAGDIVGDAEFRVISPDYFRAMVIPVREGRALGASDTADTEPVAIINEQMARQYWPAGNALGQYLTVAKSLGPGWSDSTPRRVVGIFGNVRELALDQNAPATMFVPYTQVKAPLLSSLMFCEIPSRFVVKTAAIPGSMIEQVERKVHEIDPAQALAEIKPMDRILEESIETRRLTGMVLGIFSSAAILLAILGTYSIMAQSVIQRRREIAMRMALGATSDQVFKIVLMDAVKLGCFGTALGLLLIFILWWIVQSLISGFQAPALVLWVPVSVALVLLAAVAAIIPARRAAKTDPLPMLRSI